MKKTNKVEEIIAAMSEVEEIAIKNEYSISALRWLIDVPPEERFALCQSPTRSSIITCDPIGKVAFDLLLNKEDLEAQYSAKELADARKAIEILTEKNIRFNAASKSRRI